MAGAYFKGGKLVGAGGEGDADSFLIQTFENSSLADFAQTGLVLEAGSPISGTISAKLTHQATPQFFKQTKAVAERFRGASMTVYIVAKSTADLGNITILFRDETNNIDLQTSQQIYAVPTVGVYQFGVFIPSNCANFSYTITALPQPGSPITYIDDITIKNFWLGSSLLGQTAYRMDLPAVTDWAVYAPAFAGFGIIANNNFKWRRIGNTIEVKGTVDMGSTVATTATMTLPNGYTVSSPATAGYYSIIGSWGRSAASASHGGPIIATAGGNVINFSAASTYGATSSITMAPATGSAIASPGEYLAIEFSVQVNELTATDPKSFMSTDLVPSKALVGNFTVDIPRITDWIEYPLAIQGSVSNPTLGASAVAKAHYRVVGSSMELRWTYIQIGAGTAGSGTYLFPLPNGYSIDGNKVTISTDPETATVIGHGDWNNSTTKPIPLEVMVYDSTRLYGKWINAAASTAPVVSTSWPLSNANWRMTFTASVPLANTSAIDTKTWSATQSVVTQESDGYLQINGFLPANGTTNTAILTIGSGSIVKSISDHITWSNSTTLGDTFTATKSGTYNFYMSVDTGTAAKNIGFSKNSTQLTTSITSINNSDKLYVSLDPGTGSIAVASWSGYLSVGDVIRIHGDVTAFTGASNNYSTFSCTYMGAVKQVQTVPDQKIIVPTHEVRFEGITGVGSTATGIVQFSTLAKIRGDGLEVSSNSINGTAITIKKDGILSVSTSLSGPSGSGICITRNQQSLTALSATASEILTTMNWVTTGSFLSSSWKGDVKVGDIIRVSTSSAPNAGAVYPNLNLSLEEKAVGVSVSNVLPQFSESDSSIRVDTANGYGSTNTLIRRFSNVTQNIGSDIIYTDSATAGASFTIVANGVYSITYNENWATNANSYIGISKNTTAPTTAIFSVVNSERLACAYIPVATGDGCISWIGYLSAGDIIRPHVGGALASSSTNRTNFTIAKIGKPNVSGVDVTPFIKASNLQDVQSARHTAYQQTLLSGTSSNIRYTLSNLVTKGSGIISILDDGTNTKFVALKRCNVALSTVLIIGTSASNQIQFRIDGAIVTMVSQNSSISDYCQATFNGVLEAGQTLTVATSSPVRVAVGDFQIVATATSESILTSIDSFSSDTAAFQYSSTYTISTLKDAPVGTFITYTVAASSNTPVQTASAPTQPLADMNVNGLRLFAKTSYAGVSTTAAQPGKFAIQIGRGHRGVSVRGYGNPGKSLPVNLDLMVFNTTIRGLSINAYDETTGILTLDASHDQGPAQVSWIFTGQDGSLSVTAPYLVINASKNPALAGLNNNKIACKGQNSSGQVIVAATGSVVTYDAVKTFDTTGSLNAATGVYTVPETGYYLFNGSTYYASRAYSAGNAIYFYFRINGVSKNIFIQRTPAFTNSAGVSGNELIFLNKGDTVDMFAINEAGNTALSSAFLTVNKI